MTRENIEVLTKRFFENTSHNFVSPEAALRPKLANMQIFDRPIWGIASAADPGFLALRSEGVIGPHVKMPGEWLSGARSVLSFFFPFTEQVRRANRQDSEETASEWLHGRIEGQHMLEEFGRFFCRNLGERHAVVPVLDPQFWSRVYIERGRRASTSNWSERHVAFLCGLGTFGISGGLITAKGTAGRLISIVTDLALPATPRTYRGIYEYCIRCGACARNCPARAISLNTGRDQTACSAYVEKSKLRYRPRYGCGKCQVGVACEARRPFDILRHRELPAEPVQCLSGDEGRSGDNLLSCRMN